MPIEVFDNSLTNFGSRGTLASDPGSGGTTLTLTTGHGARFPEILSGWQLRLVCEDELMICTAHTAGADTFTVTRGAESTTAAAHAAGTAVNAVMTAGAATGLAARQQVMSTALGIISENYRVSVANNTGAFPSQRIQGSLLGLCAGDVVTNLVFAVGVAAAGTAPTLLRCALLDKTGKVLVRTNDLSASAIWTSVGYAVAPLTAPYTVPATDGYYVVALENGAFGTTNVAVYIWVVTASLDVAIGSGVPLGFNQDAQTDLPAVGSSVTMTVGGNSSRLWVAVS